MMVGLAVVVALYLVVGGILAVFGPLRMLLQQVHAKAAVTGAIMQGRGGARRSRLYAPLLTGTMAIVAVVIWPLTAIAICFARNVEARRSTTTSHTSRSTPELSFPGGGSMSSYPGLLGVEDEDAKYVWA